MNADTASARGDWETGYRRFSAELADTATRAALNERLDIVIALLRKRVGGAFTLDELAGAYRDADRWLREAVEELAPPGPPAAQVIVEDAGFHLFSRGAVDFTP